LVLTNPLDAQPAEPIVASTAVLTAMMAIFSMVNLKGEFRLNRAVSFRWLESNVVREPQRG
jgi:hypothetical protein